MLMNFNKYRVKPSHQVLGQINCIIRKGKMIFIYLLDSMNNMLKNIFTYYKTVPAAFQYFCRCVYDIKSKTENAEVFDA